MCQKPLVSYLSIIDAMAFLAHDSFYNSTCSGPLFGTQNDTVINQDLTTGIEFLEVTIQLRKSESIKGLPNR